MSQTTAQTRPGSKHLRLSSTKCTSNKLIVALHFMKEMFTHGFIGITVAIFFAQASHHVHCCQQGHDSTNLLSPAAPAPYYLASWYPGARQLARRNFVHHLWWRKKSFFAP